MAYYDPYKPTEIAVDASPVGLGAILIQEGRAIAYGSKALTDVESCYSQTEREALAVVWACEHFDLYVGGANHFTILTDHKPLETIWRKPKPPLRIERWGIHLQPYKLSIKYRPGKENPADYISRHPSENVPESRAQKAAEEYVNFITSVCIPKALTLNDIKQSTSCDKTMGKALECVRTGRWYEINKTDQSDIDIDELKELSNVRDELTCSSDGILLRGDRIVLPRDLRDKAVFIAHEGHQGMNRTKSFLRSTTWFPGMNHRVENMISHCTACQTVFA